MKKFCFHYIALQICLLSLLTSCYNRFEEPVEKTLPDLPSRTLTIAQLKELYVNKGSKPLMLQHGVVIRGVVSTNDSKGNFYRTIHIQDETGGIECKMGMPNLSLIYPQGAEVAIYCEGLVLGSYGGQVNLGFKSNNPKYETGYVPDALVSDVMKKGRFVGIEPIDLTIATLSTKYANMLIRLPRVQFTASDLQQSYADPINKSNNPSVNRTLEDENGNKVIVRTSSYAQFAGKKIPDGSGSVVALLTFFSNTPQLIIIDDVTDIHLSEPRF